MKLTRKSNVKASRRTLRKTRIMANSTIEASSVDVRAIDDILFDAGFHHTNTKVSRVHDGTEINFSVDNESEATLALDVLRDNGYEVRFDTVKEMMLGFRVYAYILGVPDEEDEGVYYTVYFDYTSETVRMNYPTSDYGAIIDALIDKMESEGKFGNLYTIDEAESEDWFEYEDEYVIGGNHGLVLYTHGNLSIEEV